MKATRENTCAIRPSAWVRLVPLLTLAATAPAFGQGVYEEGIEVLTRGPVHEAFAQASMVGPTAGIIVTRAPYEPIPELPPDQRPEGPNVAWIPGYWGWEEDRDDFIWVSGVWRVIPPNREWVPGYWASVGNNVQWISGFWREINQTQVVYLPPPPETVEVGPSSPSPGPDYIWAPGCWLWRESRFHWRPGYWILVRPDWVWVPAYYSWTPRGCVFVPGYWDYDLRHRGVMFAPVHYRQPVFRRAGYLYSPSIVIDLGIITAHFFVQPRTCHYYYGDYYDHRYEERGFYPWHSSPFRRYGDDPLYSHFRYRQLQRDPHWDTYVVDRFKHYREDVQARPPRTLDLQASLTREGRPGPAAGMMIGRSLADAVENRVVPMRFRSISMDERRKVETRGMGVRRLQTERAQTEVVTAPAGGDKPRSALESARPVRARLTASPVAARSVEGAKAPPPPAAPAAETTVREVETPAPVTPEPARRRTQPRREGVESVEPAPQPVERRTIRKPQETETETVAPEPVRRRTAPRREIESVEPAPQPVERRTIRKPEEPKTETVAPEPVRRRTAPGREIESVEPAPQPVERRTIRKPEEPKTETVAPEPVRRRTAPRREIESVEPAPQPVERRTIRKPQEPKTETVAPEPVRRRTAPRRERVETESVQPEPIQRRAIRESGGVDRGKVRENVEAPAETGTAGKEVKEEDATSGQGKSENRAKGRGSRTRR